MQGYRASILRFDDEGRALHEADGLLVVAPGADGTPVVRERFWLTVQPGEIRACDGCHGINRSGQAAQPAATNTPLALVALVQQWSAARGGLMFADGLE